MIVKVNLEETISQSQNVGNSTGQNIFLQQIARKKKEKIYVYSKEL